MRIDAIVFIHHGAHDYIRHVINVASASNRDTRIILLGDQANRTISRDIEHHYISDYQQDILCFENTYLHLSTNPYDFEFFCIYRWLVLSCFCERNGIQGLFHADSDVLIYSSMADIAKALDDCEAAISWGVLRTLHFGPQRRCLNLATS